MEDTAKNNFLGVEKVGKLMKMFAIPCVLSLIIQSLYNLVDQIYIGNCATLGATGNAATGIVYPLTVIALGIGLWIGDGCAACMSLNQGQGNTKGTAKSVGTALFYGTIASIVFMIMCFCLKDKILVAIGAQGDILDKSSEYANFIIGGFLFFTLACVLNPIVRADGSPKFAMLAMAIGAIINIALDPLFIFGFKMGMTGAALATFLGQLITFVLHVAYLFKSKTFKLKIADFIPSKAIGSILKFGISSLLTQLAIVIISIVNNILLFKYSASSGYDTAITQGVITLAFKVFGIVVSVAIGIASGAQPVIGYNYGAKKYDRVKKALLYMMIATVVVGVIATIIFEAVPQVFLLIFGNGGEGVDPVIYKEFTCLTFRIYLGFILFTCIVKNLAIFFQAIGSPIKATIISMMRDVIILVPLSIIMAKFGGIDALLWSAPISDTVGVVLALVLTLHALRVMNKKAKEVQVEDTAQIRESQQGVIVTLARQHGASGRKIGKLLAEKLGVPYYNKDLTLLTAQESGLSSEYVRDVEDGKLQKIETLYIGLDPTDQARIAQEKVLKSIAEKGSCVIVGRASDKVLAEYKPLRVFIHAPLEYRVERIMLKYGDSKEKAEEFALKSDKRRAKYYELITGNKWGESSNYDLTVDGSIGVENAVDVILEFINKR
ncbi:MAG: cytidylate kinase family protein [Clostridia bacterium]|nr:cytidylate kinase family protein [Clostridia bacterium]